VKKRRTRKGNSAVQISPTPLRSGYKRNEEGIKKIKKEKKEKIERIERTRELVYDAFFPFYVPCLST
jgi:hypothetical protein